MNTIQTAELSTTCVCEVYDEATDTATPAPDCYGDCWQDGLDSVTEILREWADTHGVDLDTPIRINGSGMGWQRLAGHIYTPLGSVVEMLKINGEFTLRFKLVGDELKVVRSSHDELGALFEVLLITDTDTTD